MTKPLGAAHHSLRHALKRPCRPHPSATAAAPPGEPWLLASVVVSPSTPGPPPPRPQRRAPSPPACCPPRACSRQPGSWASRPHSASFRPWHRNTPPDLASKSPPLVAPLRCSHAQKTDEVPFRSPGCAQKRSREQQLSSSCCDDSC